MSKHVDITCADCGIEFCLPADVCARRHEDHKTFYCPSGHGNYYPGESPKERTIRLLRRDFDWAQNRVAARDERIEALEHEVRSLRSRLSWARRRAA